MAQKEKEPCKDGKHCPGFVSNELCQARREAMCERIDGLKKQIWASAATVGFILSLVEVSLRYGGR